MTHIVVRLACALVLSAGLAACGGDGDEATAPAPVGVLGPAELGTALITAAEVPADYDEVAPRDDETDSDLFDGTCLEGVQDFSAQVGAEPVSEAETEFSHQDGDGEAQILSGIRAFADENGLAEGITAFGDSLAACRSINRTDEDGVTFAFDVTSSDEVTITGAEQQLLVTLEGTITAGPEGLRLSFGMLVVRTGSYLARIGTAELGADHGLAAQIRPLATVQLGRLIDLLANS